MLLPLLLQPLVAAATTALAYVDTGCLLLVLLMILLLMLFLVQLFGRTPQFTVDKGCWC